MQITEQLWAAQQGRLADLGFYTGAIDGLPGPLTEFALTEFKSNNGLRARAFPGPVTMSRLWDPAAKRRPAVVVKGDEPAWLAEARRCLGTTEIPGPGNNPAIMGWARDLDQWYPGDDVPWCGLFVGHCVSVGAPEEPQDFNRLGARQWLQFGEECGPKLGAICVLWRTHKTKSWNGHVFFVTGISENAVRGIGGNQSDSVREDWFSKGRVLGYRRPVGAHLKPAPYATTGTLSKREA